MTDPRHQALLARASLAATTAAIERELWHDVQTLSAELRWRCSDARASARATVEETRALIARLRLLRDAEPLPD